MWTNDFEMALATKRVNEMVKQFGFYGEVDDDDDFGLLQQKRVKLAKAARHRMYRAKEKMDMVEIERRPFSSGPERDALTAKHDELRAPFLLAAAKIADYWMMYMGSKVKHDRELREFYWPPKDEEPKG